MDLTCQVGAPKHRLKGVVGAALNLGLKLLHQQKLRMNSVTRNIPQAPSILLTSYCIIRTLQGTGQVVGNVHAVLATSQTVRLWAYVFCRITGIGPSVLVSLILVRVDERDCPLVTATAATSMQNKRQPCHDM